MQKLLILALFIASCFALAPLFQASEHKINGSYIIVYHDKVPQSKLAEHKTTLQKMHPNHQITHSYEVVLNGYAANLTPEGVNFLRASPEVSYVEEDQLMFASNLEACTSQSGAPWGIARISVKSPSQATNKYDYLYNGAGVRVYIVDTGIYRAHTAFGGRAKFGYSAITGETADADLNGHGTHVAGTVGSSTYGVAKGCTLIAVKVLSGSGSGSNSGVINGIEFVGKNATKNKDVVNMSLGGGISSALDTAISNLNSGGITVVVAAGNDNKDACNYSPARAASAYTVGATQQGTTGSSTDPRASFSNFGACLNNFAPGESILSTWIGSTTATRTISGTSMASPHIAGVAALILGRASATPASVKTQLTDQAVAGTIGNAGKDSPNRMVYTGGCA